MGRLATVTRWMQGLCVSGDEVWCDSACCWSHLLLITCHRKEGLPESCRLTDTPLHSRGTGTAGGGWFSLFLSALTSYHTRHALCPEIQIVESLEGFTCWLCRMCRFSCESVGDYMSLLMETVTLIMNPPDIEVSELLQHIKVQDFAVLKVTAAWNIRRL